jgi:hypothetical protein
VELDVASIVAWTLHVVVAGRLFAAHKAMGRPAHERHLNLLFGQSQVTPLTIGAVALTLGYDWGLYFTAVAVVCALMVAVINGWVLLVEILR